MLGGTDFREDIIKDSLQQDAVDVEAAVDASGAHLGSSNTKVAKGRDDRHKARVGDAKGKPGQGQSGEPQLAMHRRDVKMNVVTESMVKAAMKQDRVCAHFEEPELQMIMQTVEYFEFAAGDTVVKQGDTGTYFFVIEKGRLAVSVNDKVVNTLERGQAFGGLALLYNCPRTATVVAKEASAVWGANGETFKMALQENSQKFFAENRRFLDSISMFDGLSAKQKTSLSQATSVEFFEANARVVTEGEATNAMYFVKKGSLKVLQGAAVDATGKVSGGKPVGNLRAGDSFGERSVLYNELRSSTVVTETQCELLTVGVESLKEVLGNDLAQCLEQSFVLSAMKKSVSLSQFSASQQHRIIQNMDIKRVGPEEKIDEDARFVLVIDGAIKDEKGGSLGRGQYYEDDTFVQTADDLKTGQSSRNLGDLTKSPRVKSRNFTAGADGARIALLTQDGMAKSMQELGMSAMGGTAEAVDFARKMILVKKVHIFRHLAEQQINDLVGSFVLQKYKKGADAIKQGEVGSAFFLIASGEVQILINDNPVRTLSKNAYFGERALLFDEPRTATVRVTSNEAELWSIEKDVFTPIVRGKMQEELVHRIRLQDTSVTLKDLKHVKLIGAGAAGVVRLVQHKKTSTRYALKRVLKENGKIPEEVTRECSLLAANDHPFVMHLVKNFETTKSVYILTELITGGELHAALRKIPTVLSHLQAQFYTGSLVLVLESLQDRNIVYRDLKPENVMLDAQGYLKLIDFGIAKKLEEGKSRTFTMIGTPHYMAPEVMRGHGYGTEVDIWSLGVMQFEFVCGYLPFADDLDDPTAVCTAVLRDPLNFPGTYRDQAGKMLMQGMLCRQPKKRLGAGINGYEEIKKVDYFTKKVPGNGNIFQQIMGRQCEPPLVPGGEQYSNPEDLADVQLSDKEELG